MINIIVKLLCEHEIFCAKVEICMVYVNFI